MFENNLYHNFVLHADHYEEDRHTRRYNNAVNGFKAAMFKGKLTRLKRRLLHDPQWLYDLTAIKACVTLRGLFYSGIKVVGIKDIIGTEGRNSDFDIDFYPIKEDSRERWVNMALAHLSRTPLPPVELIQIGDKYFVRDGHHRISVAYSFGQISMDAEVVTWQAHPPFPWQADAQFRPVHLTS